MELLPTGQGVAMVSKAEVSFVARETRKFDKFGMKHVALSVAKDDLSRYLREAEGGAILITRHGKPAGILTGFASEEDWFDYRLEHDPRFAKRMEAARASLRASKGLKMKDRKS
jgi:prevent-host-death family protein